MWSGGGRLPILTPSVGFIPFLTRICSKSLTELAYSEFFEYKILIDGHFKTELYFKFKSAGILIRGVSV